MGSISIRLTYEDLFDEYDTIDNLIKVFSKSDIFRIVALLNSKNKLNQNSAKTIKDWFSNKKISENLIKKLNNENSHITNSYSSLSILNYIYQCDEEVDKLEADEFELKLFKLYLLLNSKQSYLENSKLSEYENLDLEYRFLATLIGVSYYDNDYSKYDLSKIFFCQLIKSVQFFKFLENNLKNHLLLFLRNYNCKSWEEWIRKLLNFIIPVVKHDDNTFSEIQLKSEDISEQGKFLSLFSNNIEIKGDADFIELRRNPIYKVSDTNYIVLHKLFLIERIYKSITFEFSLEINEKVEDEFKVKDFKSTLADKFSEQILLYDFINKSFPNNDKFKKIPGSTFVGNGFKGEPDYYIRFKNKILLFESKDVILKGEVKQSRDFFVLEKELKDKFLVSEKNGKKSNKAILQLIENIVRFKSKYYLKIDDRYNEEKIKIFPIIVTHDRQFDAPAVNKILNIWFKSELSKKFSKEEILNIHDLTIINIDDILLYHEIFYNRGKNSMEYIINEYHKFVVVNGHKSIAVFRDNYLKRTMSFNNFLENYFSIIGIKPPKIIRDYIKLLKYE